MAILTMDTATDALAVAVGDKERTRASMAVLVPRAHSRLLQPSIVHVLQASGISAKELTMIGVGVGPGSYTGVRMAVSTAKAMADALQIPLVPIPTLAALAETAMPAHVSFGVVLTLLFARRGRAFGAIYEKRGHTWRVVTDLAAQPIDDWITQFQTYILQTAPQHIAIVHDFQESHGVLPLLANVEVPRVHLLDVVGGLGPALVRLALSGEYRAYQGVEIHPLAPVYALEVQAEVQVKQKENGGASLVTGI
jgi:tRNA threonylcarbamoyladenosine biosynthesis protein TsaB